VVNELRAIGISPHTGWGACVVVGGSPRRPEIVANQIIHVLGEAERFCFHMAAEMARADARRWIARARRKALANAKRALAPLLGGNGVDLCAIVARDRDAGDLDHVLASHPRIHTAEGCFYRDVFREACGVPAQLLQPSSLDPSAIGRLAPPPWGRDQKLAALAAWTALGSRSRDRPD
jgi:hypothetical protein